MVQLPLCSRAVVSATLKAQLPTPVAASTLTGPQVTVVAGLAKLAVRLTVPS